MQQLVALRHSGQSPMETIVEGEDIDPSEMSDPTWATIRHKQFALKEAEQRAASQARAHLASSPPTRGRRAPKRHPPASPLPEKDVKIILRPRGGLALSTVSVAALADAIQRQAGVSHNDEDQVRIQSTSNFIIVSTPSEDRARNYEKIVTLTVQGKQYATSTHVAAPANTTTGVIFNVPETDTAEQVLDSVCRYNPDLQILDARRLNSSNIVKILFNGTRVPFWVRYRAATYRCKPFRRKTEACTACWQPGHRQDVCPSTQIAQRCPKCGLSSAPDDHECTPKCIVCDGPHLTGSAECPRRYQPRRQPLTYAQAANSKAASATKEEDFPPLLNKLPSKTAGIHNATKQDAAKKHHQVSCTRSLPSSAPSKPPFLPHNSDPHLELIKELRAIRAEVATLRQENAALKRELQLAKKQPSPTSPPENEPIQMDIQLSPPSQSPETTDPAASPPPKRKAVSTGDSPCASTRDEKLEILEQTIASHREEYLQLHNVLLQNQTALQSTIEMMRLDFRNFIGSQAVAHNTPLPPADEDDV